MIDETTLAGNLSGDIRALTASLTRREQTETDTLAEIKEIKVIMVGTPTQRGLIHRVDEIEVFHRQLRRWAIVALIAIVGGEPVVDRVLPRGLPGVQQQPQAQVPDITAEELISAILNGGVKTQEP